VRLRSEAAYGPGRQLFPFNIQPFGHPADFLHTSLAFWILPVLQWKRLDELCILHNAAAAPADDEGMGRLPAAVKNSLGELRNMRMGPPQSALPAGWYKHHAAPNMLLRHNITRCLSSSLQEFSNASFPGPLSRTCNESASHCGASKASRYVLQTNGKAAAQLRLSKFVTGADTRVTMYRFLATWLHLKCPSSHIANEPCQRCCASYELPPAAAAAWQMGQVAFCASQVSRHALQPCIQHRHIVTAKASLFGSASAASAREQG
jgi:hypothetical protein